MYCPYCGISGLNENADVCASCGKDLAILDKESDSQCLKCGKSINNSTSFCCFCGNIISPIPDKIDKTAVVSQGMRIVFLSIIILFVCALIIYPSWISKIYAILVLVALVIFLRNERNQNNPSESGKVVRTKTVDDRQILAKQFFVERIITQTKKDKIILSEAEKYMLNFSETDGGFILDQTLQEQFDNETTDEEFEKKIIKLIRKIYNNDVKNNPEAKSKYRRMYRDLKRGDHYILIMIDEAIGYKLNFFSFLGFSSLFKKNP